MNCIVMDYSNGVVDIFSYNHLKDNVEEMLATRYKHSNIEYMCVKEVRINKITLT